MPLYVRDERVREMAAQLADRRDCSVTDAVRFALTEALARDDAAREEKRRKARAILAKFDAAPRLSNFSAEDLYDEDGLPIA